MKQFAEKMHCGLVWLPELGTGHYPVPQENRSYDTHYFSHYQMMANTGMGQQLTDARVALVARHYTGLFLDVGIGSGQFVENRRDTLGYDVNPVGIEWLNQRNVWADLYSIIVLGQP